MVFCQPKNYKDHVFISCFKCFVCFPPSCSPRCHATPRHVSNPKVLHWPPKTPTMWQQPQWQQRRRRVSLIWEMFFVGLKREPQTKVSWFAGQLTIYGKLYVLMVCIGMWNMILLLLWPMITSYESYAWLCYHQPNLVADSKTILTVVHKFFER